MYFIKGCNMHGTLERICSVKDNTQSNMTQFSLISIIAVFLTIVSIVIVHNRNLICGYITG